MTTATNKRRLERIEAKRPGATLPLYLAAATVEDLAAALAALPPAIGKVTGYAMVSPDDWDGDE